MSVIRCNVQIKKCARCFSVMELDVTQVNVKKQYPYSTSRDPCCEVWLTLIPLRGGEHLLTVACCPLLSLISSERTAGKLFAHHTFHFQRNVMFAIALYKMAEP